jgi:protein subunit release factor B
VCYPAPPPVSRTFFSFQPQTRTFSTANDEREWKVPKTIYIPEHSLEISFVRSSGAGGQNVNKVNTQVQIRFHVSSADWMPSEVRRRLAEQQASRVNKEGYLQVSSQEHRTQTANRRAALDKLQQMVAKAWPRPAVRKMRTGLSEAGKERRKEEKQRRKLKKQSRRPVRFDD